MNGQFRPHNYVELLCSQWTLNSHLEGWVQQIKENCKKRHTQICMRHWSFFRESKLQQKSITLQQLEAGGVRKAKRRKVIQREEKIKSLQHDTTTGETLTLISAVRHCVVTFD